MPIIAAVAARSRAAVRRIAPHARQVTALAFCALLLLGWLLRGSYGLSMDEIPLLAYGQQAWDYFFFDGAPEPAAVDWTFHTPLLQMAFIAVTRIVRIADMHDMLLAKRFFNIVVFSVGWLAFLGLVRRLTGSRWWALLGGLWLILSPRLFAHAFYNPKDVPTLAFFTLAVLLLVRLLERPTFLRLALFALAAGFTISLRPFGLLLPCLALLPLCFEAWENRGAERRRWLLLAGGAVLATAVCTVAVWPLLWHDPVGRFLGAIGDNVSRNDEGFYLGMTRSRFPWHYLFVWMGVTIPAAYTVLFLAGTAFAATWAVRQPRSFLRESPVAALALLWFALPVAARLTGRIGLFDEWRHLLFVYPAFLLLALAGCRALLAALPRRWMRGTAAALVAAQMASVGWWMVRNHPFEYMYFSVPAAWAQGRMELDYWGVSHREGLRWILANDPRPSISVYIRDTDGVATVPTMTEEERARLRVMKRPDAAEYILDTLRWSGYEHVVPPDRLVHALSVDGLAFLWIYRGPFETDRFPVYDWCEYCRD
ncbi:MAG: glycosyltransferase family 39 protein [Candidatus Peribacteraceae bacterium]|nr:glycosyltransferase family 39 protein [Candidatus Peribacteraceae bacterium]